MMIKFKKKLRYNNISFTNNTMESQEYSIYMNIKCQFSYDGFETTKLPK